MKRTLLGTLGVTCLMSLVIFRGLHIALVAQGAYFSRPYGDWADMVYARDADARQILRLAKGIVDPKNVLNPGKLCF